MFQIDHFIFRVQAYLLFVDFSNSEWDSAFLNRRLFSGVTRFTRPKFLIFNKLIVRAGSCDSEVA